MKTDEDIKKHREEILEALVTAKGENVPWLQGAIYGLDYLTKEEKEE